MIKLLGTAMIVLGSGSAGFGFARAVRAQLRQLNALLAALEIDVISLEAPPLECPAASYARNFAKSCGVSQAILQEIGKEGDNGTRPKIDEKFINGLDRKSVNLLKLYAKGKLPGNFVEVMACAGGCVGGPCSLAR